jgi:hypothetical protein
MLNRDLASPIAKTNMLLLYKKAIFIAFYNHLCACQLSQHDLAVRIAFPHSLQPVLTSAGRAFSLISLTMTSPNLRLFLTPATLSIRNGLKWVLFGLLKMSRERLYRRGSTGTGRKALIRRRFTVCNLVFSLLLLSNHRTYLEHYGRVVEVALSR